MNRVQEVVPINSADFNAEGQPIFYKDSREWCTENPGTARALRGPICAEAVLGGKNVAKAVVVEQ